MPSKSSQQANLNKIKQSVSKFNIRQAIDVAEAEFRTCFEIVASLNSPEKIPAIPNNIVGFQIRLFRAIEPLEELYRLIKREERRLVQRKMQLDRSWFERRMAKLAFYSKSLIEALTIGRTIGDGFAWFFYQNDRSLIAEHLKQQKQLLLPPDVGRLGERLALEKMQGLGGKFLLHHGITSFLRIGDFSLIDLSTSRVLSIGELKTQIVEKGKATLDVTFISGEKNHLENLFVQKPASSASATKQPSKLPKSMQGRLDRQIQTMSATIRKIKKEGIERVSADQNKFLYDALENVVRRCHNKAFEFIQADDGLIIGALRLTNSQTLGSVLLNDEEGNINRLISPVVEWVQKISQPESELNGIFIAGIGNSKYLSFSAEKMPLLMWPVNADVLQNVLFGKVLVITLFNPVHFLEKLKQRGYDVSWNSDVEFIQAIRKDGESVTEIKNFDYFFRLIQHSLMTEESVLAMIEQMTSLAQARKGKNKSMHLEFHPVIHHPAALKGSKGLE